MKRPRLRRRSPRLPFIVLLVAAIGAAVWQARTEDDRGNAAADAVDADPGPASGMPAVADADALA